MVIIGWLLLTGFAAGFIGSALGLGGGVLLIPVLALVFDLPMHTAIATSLVAVVATSCTGASSYLKAGLVNVRLALILEITTVIGAIGGGLLAALAADSALSLLFGLVMLYTAYSLLRGQSPPSETTAASPGKADEQTCEDGDWFSAEHRRRLECTYTDRAEECEVCYRPQHILLGMGFSTIAGAMSGLLGIGGGVVKIPIMHLIMKVPVRAAAATSAYMIGITGIASAFIYYGNGFVDPLVTIPAVVGIFFGAFLGARVAQLIRSTSLSRALAVVLLVVGIQMLLRAVGITLI